MFEVPQPATALHRFAESHYEALQHAAFRLGGQAALHRAQSLLDDLARGGQITRRMFKEADMLHSLFAGQTAEVAGKEARSVPRDQHSEYIDLLAEGFSEALVRSRLQASSDEVEKEIAHD